MNTKEHIALYRLVAQNFSGIVVIVAGILLISTVPSLAFVTMNPDSPIPDCTGSFSVSGLVTCPDDECDNPPSLTISVSPSGDTYPNVPLAGSCSDDVFQGTFGAGVSLENGVNIITAADSCGGQDSITVVSNGGDGGPAVGITVTSMGCSGTGGNCGAYVDFNFICLNPTNTYTWWETVNTDNGCAVNANGFPCAYVLLANSPCDPDSNGNATVIDTAKIPCPAHLASGTFSPCTCTSSQTWWLTCDQGGATVLGPSTTTRNKSATAQDTSSVTVSGANVESPSTINCP